MCRGYGGQGARRLSLFWLSLASGSPLLRRLSAPPAFPSSLLPLPPTTDQARGPSPSSSSPPPLPHVSPYVHTASFAAAAVGALVSCLQAQFQTGALSSYVLFPPGACLWAPNVRAPSPPSLSFTLTFNQLK